MGTLTDNRADLAVTCAIQKRVDERLGLITGGKPSRLHVGSVDIPFDDLSAIRTIVIEEVRKAAKFESGKVSTDQDVAW